MVDQTLRWFHRAVVASLTLTLIVSISFHFSFDDSTNATFWTGIVRDVFFVTSIVLFLYEQNKRTSKKI